MIKRLRLTAMAAAVSTLLLGAVSVVQAQQLPQTWQEQQDFRSGPTPFAELMQFWYELDAGS